MNIQKLLSKFYCTQVALKTLPIVEVVKSLLAPKGPKRALDLLVFCLNTQNLREFINKASGECRNQIRYLRRLLTTKSFPHRVYIYTAKSKLAAQIFAGNQTKHITFIIITGVEEQSFHILSTAITFIYIDHVTRYLTGPIIITAYYCFLPSYHCHLHGCTIQN